MESAKEGHGHQLHYEGDHVNEQGILYAMARASREGCKVPTIFLLRGAQTKKTLLWIAPQLQVNKCFDMSLLISIAYLCVKVLKM